MKLVFLKLSALLVIIVGIAFVGQFIQCPYVCSYIEKTTDGSLDVLFPGSFKLLSGIAFILIGVYSFLPSLRRKKPAIRIIKQNLENGVSEINLATVEKECEAMLKKVAPLKQVSITLTPSKDQKKVCVVVNPIINLTEDQNLPDIQELIIHRIEEFLNSYFGLSISPPVLIKLDSFQLDSDKIYSSLGKTAFDTISQKYETTETNIPEEKTVQTKTSLSTAPLDEKPISDDYLSCKIEEPKQEEINPLPTLSDLSNPSDLSDKSDWSDKSDSPNNTEFPKY
ncbi:MAG TPA: hypothetical protein PLT82_07985 [Candidatus Hydrogenedens sp.]|nr:hypothetical protein [Candidatus Hydrogenedens sp.]HOL20052.1 hypothetical protein [Candidatus Hydrogenedens sp.]HPP59055.1 hypothetical protein [Candidatus Hydrogenedens sp.]